MVCDPSGVVSGRRVSWTHRVTIVGLAALLSGGCLETSAEDVETGNADIAVDVAEEVADISPDETTSDVTATTETEPTGSGSSETGSSGTEPSETVVSSTPDDASPDMPVSGDGADDEEPASGTSTPSTTTTTTPTVSTTATIRPTTTTTTAAVATGTASALDVLTVAVETARSGYDRDLFPHWSDTNASGCDARQDTLAAQVIGLPQVDLVDRCVIVEGDWYSIYDGVTHAGSPSELDVDHVVSLAEAWDSGASTWSRDRRRAFANDPRNLIAVTAASNRSKGDRDLGEWRPAQRSAWCVTATMAVETKAAYGLSVDPSERAAIVDMLGTCGGSDQVTIGRSAAAPSPVNPAPASSAPATTAPTTAAPAPPPAEEAAPGCVDINSAGVADLERIIHIGPARAAEMLSLRPFSSVADMDRITGIGAGRLADIVAEGLACVP